jgi:hypothetical protein
MYSIIILDAVFLELLFRHIKHSKFLVPTHSIPKMNISVEKKSLSSMAFFEYQA